MEPLGKEAEARLMEALDKVATFVDAGDTPTGAVVKAARELRIPGGHIQLLTNAYNIGRTNRQREEGTDVWDKAASFELADPKAALAQLYPAEIKTASQRHRDCAVSSEYQRSPRSLLADRRQPAFVEKAASFQVNGSPRLKESTNPETLSKRATADMRRREIALEEDRAELGRLFEKMAADVVQFVNYFKRSDALPFSDVARDLQLAHGQAGQRFCKAAIDLAYEPLDKMQKHAATGRPTCLTGEPHTFATAFFSHQEAYVTKQAAFLAAETKFAADKKALLHLPDEPRPFSLLDQLQPPPPGFSILQCLQQTSLQQRKEAAGPGGPFMGALTGSVVKDLTGQAVSALQPPAMSKLIQNYLQELQDPSHEGALHEIRTQSTIHNLLANDPILSGHKPDDVLHAINDIISVAPRIADQSPMLQSATRRHVQQGQLDPFEIEQLLNIDSKLKARDEGKTDISMLLGSHKA